MSRHPEPVSTHRLTIGDVMGNVVMHNVVSVDGFIADEDDQVGPLLEWYFNGEHTMAGDARGHDRRAAGVEGVDRVRRPMWAASARW